MIPQTGEILALANLPSYDPSDLAASSLAQRTNHAISYVYEPGSVFKIVTASAALEEEVATESDEFYCEKGEYRVGNHILHDHRPHGTLNFVEVFEKSSNICVTKIAQMLGPDVVFDYAKRFQFGRSTGIDLKGEVSGFMRAPAYWSKTTIGAFPIGHEVTVTPLQLVAAISAIANDGIYMKPFVVKYIKDDKGEIIRVFEPTVVDRVISPQTAHRVKAILQGVVDRGTGRNARIKNVGVAGKTGTAQKVIDGAYSHSKFYATFFGFAPVEDPRLAIMVVLNEPRPSHYGGTVAAPVFKEVMENALKYLQAIE